MADTDWENALNPKLSLDSEGVTQDDVQSTLQVDKPGKYHFEIAEAREDFSLTNKRSEPQAPHILCTCVVLHTVPGQSPRGSVLWHRINLGGKGGAPLDENGKRMTISFLAGVGLLKDQGGKFIDPQTGTTAIDIATLASRLKSMQFIGDPKPDTYEGRTSFRFNFGRGVFRIDDPLVATVPKDKGALDAIGMGHCMAAAAPASAKKEPAKKAPAKKAEPKPAGEPVAVASEDGIPADM